jgi:hypothetical protein
VEGYCEHSNELSGSIELRDILQWLRDLELPKKNQAVNGIG